MLRPEAAISKLNLVPHTLHVEQVVGIVGVFCEQCHYGIRKGTPIRQKRVPCAHRVQKSVEYNTSDVRVLYVQVSDVCVVYTHIHVYICTYTYDIALQCVGRVHTHSQSVRIYVCINA